MSLPRKSMRCTVYELAIRDALTRAYSPMKFKHLLRTESTRVSQHGGALSLLAFDLDHFRQFNDRHGHLKGDQFLQGLAVALQRNIRASDWLCRWADEEFMVLSPLGLDEATGFAVKLRRYIAEQHYDRTGLVTASFGVCQYRRGEPTAEFITRAEAAMHRAKNSGRNRIAVDKS